MIRKNQTSQRFTSPVTDGSEQEISEMVPKIDLKQKREIWQLIITSGILLIVGVTLCFLIPYTKDLTNIRFIFAPKMLINVLILPFFWLLAGWTFMQIFGVLRIVEINHTKLSKAIHIITLTLVLLYTAIMLPYIIETVRLMALEIEDYKNPDAFPNGFSFSYHIPIFLQRIQQRLISISNKSVIFTLMGIILWICKSEKRK